MRVSDIQRVLTGARVLNMSDREVAGITNDSRRVGEGDVFVAIRGAKQDGHDFTADAFRAGAAACVCEREAPSEEKRCRFIVEDASVAFSALSAEYYGHPSKDLMCVGVTGTDGKTTTASLIHRILDARTGAGLTGTVAYRFGGDEVPAERTTPDAATLQEMLRKMVRAGQRYAVVEVSSHALVQHRTADVDFNVGVFTNLSPEHLDYHWTIEEYRAAKGLLFESLPSDGWAILNGEDPASDYMAGVTKAHVLRYGKGGDMTAHIVECAIGRTTMVIEGMGMESRIETAMTGSHNVHNVLAAACAARSLGAEVGEIEEALQGVSPVPGRLERVETDLGCVILVDYAHTTRALTCVLSELRSLCGGRLIVVFGCGGDRDQAKRPEMGVAAENIADAVWVTSDNPRSEDPDAIIKEILSGMTEPGRVNVEADREGAIRGALESAAAGDVVLIAGKGHEKVQLAGEAVIPFDDREVARRIAMEIIEDPVESCSGTAVYSRG